MVKLLEHTPKVVKDNIVTKSVQILACYRKNCASPSSAGQLILPECMKLLPLYLSCLLKNDAFSGGSDMSCDDRSYVMQYVLSMDLPTSVLYFYPRLIPIHDVDVNEEDVPSPIRCTVEKLMENGAYILDNGIHMFVWLGQNLPPEFTQAVFGAVCTAAIDTDRVGIPVLDTPLSRRIHQIVETIQSERKRYMRVRNFIIIYLKKFKKYFLHLILDNSCQTT